MFKFVAKGDSVGMNTEVQFDGSAMDAAMCYAATINSVVKSFKKTLSDNLPDARAKALFGATISSIVEDKLGEVTTADILDMAGELYDNIKISDIRNGELEHDEYDDDTSSVKRFLRIVPPEELN